MKYGSNTKTARNQAIREYQKSHKELSLKEIGEAFGISKQRVWRICKDETCDNCYHNGIGCCSCRDAADVIHAPNKCCDWAPKEKPCEAQETS